MRRVVIVAVTIGVVAGMAMLREFTITQGLSHSHSARAFKYCNGEHGSNATITMVAEQVITVS
jgi:hypothetical protein